MQISIVEDESESELLKEIEVYLLKESYVCEVNVSFNDAIEKLHLYHYDIAIIDITLPGGSGLSLIQSLKKQNSDTGILIISAKNSLDNKLSGLEIGVDDYIAKPLHLA